MNKQSRGDRKINFLLYTIFIFYILVMVFLLVTRFQPVYWITGDPYYYSRILPRAYNLIPLRSIGAYTWRHANILGNILLFIPLGVYYQMFRPRKDFLPATLFVLLTSLAAEILQYILATGTFDVDDLILNTAGGVAGVLAYILLWAVLKRNERQTRMMIAAAGTTLAPYLLISAIKFWQDIENIVLKYSDVLVLLAFYGFLFWFLRTTPKSFRRAVIVSGIAFSVFYFAVVIQFI